MDHRRHYSFFFLCAVAALGLATFKGIHGVEFVVTNNAETTPGGTRFNNELGADYTKQTMDAATNFIWNIFQQNTDADRKNVATVTLTVENREGIAATSGDVIHVGADYIKGIQGDIKTDFNGVLYHEMTHVWQWSGANSNTGLIEGIADFVRLKAGYAPSHWVGAGGGDRWDQGYDVTARFLDYCEGLRSGFVAELNKKMRDTYSDDYFNQLLGKPVDQLWREYKAAYGG
ncbi:uncharacterized protein LOC114737430 [Neltuma alba]|uniref:uncharacterized protein LOC114737430 n=1 Tax=Neltuma alba TaxID=207710 RepID=UPI0010A501AF|nr:uncharacterized protein LOC114737430 [Prosopis alba]